MRERVYATIHTTALAYALGIVQHRYTSVARRLQTKRCAMNEGLGKGTRPTTALGVTTQRYQQARRQCHVLSSEVGIILPVS